MIPRRSRTPAHEKIPRRTRTAYHEAGHAVLSAAISDEPRHVSIRENGHTLGRVGARGASRPTSQAQVYLAGFAAEHVLTKRRQRQLDQEVAFAIIGRRDPKLSAAFAGAEARDGHRAVQEVLRTTSPADDDEITREVDRLYEIARESLAAVWPAVMAVAKALLEHEELDSDGLDEAIGEVDIRAPVIAVQRAHGLLSEAPPVAPKVAIPEPIRKSPKKRATRASDDPRVTKLLAALEADPKLAPIVEAYEAGAKVSSGRKFGANGLKVNGKLFALFTQDTLVVKLPKERVAALVTSRVGEPFDPGHGRLMKEWLTVTSAKVSWTDLAKEAHEFVSGGKRR